MTITAIFYICLIFQRSSGLLGALVAIGVLLPERAKAVVNYVVDDGTINSAVGVGGAGGDLMALNRFTVQAGGGEVTLLLAGLSGALARRHRSA